MIKFGRRRIWALAALQLAFAYVWVFEPNWIEVTRHEISIPTLPSEFDGVTLAQLSDLHIRTFGLRERRTVQLLAEAKPDLIVISGDFTVEGSDAGAISRFLLHLRDLRPPLGTLAVLGNHDHWHPPVQSPGAIVPFFSDAGATILTNEFARIREGSQVVVIAGVDDPFTGHADLRRALEGSPPDTFTLLLSHSPEIFPETARTQVNLVLAGHTHGGQLRLPFLDPLWLPHGSESYVSGWFELGPARMFVTRGIGTAILPFRFLCRPELPLITLRVGRRAP